MTPVASRVRKFHWGFVELKRSEFNRGALCLNFLFIDVPLYSSQAVTLYHTFSKSVAESLAVCRGDLKLFFEREKLYI
jgi:hypothetical protein